MNMKIWSDCPSCGSNGSMQRNESMTFRSSKYKLLIDNLKGYSCSQCHDGIYDPESNAKVQQMIREAKSFK